MRFITLTLPFQGIGSRLHLQDSCFVSHSVLIVVILRVISDRTSNGEAREEGAGVFGPALWGVLAWNWGM